MSITMMRRREFPRSGRPGDNGPVSPSRRPSAPISFSPSHGGKSEKGVRARAPRPRHWRAPTTVPSRRRPPAVTRTAASEPSGGPDDSDGLDVRKLRALLERWRVRARLARAARFTPARLAVVVFAVIVAVIVFGVLLFIRYRTYKTLRDRSINTPNYNGPAGPQYGVTGAGGYSPQYQQVPPTTPFSPQGYAGYGGPQGYTPGTGYGGQVPPDPASGPSYSG